MKDKNHGRNIGTQIIIIIIIIIITTTKSIKFTKEK
jgi:hypothetical protein